MGYRDRLLAEHEREMRQAHRHVLFVLLHTMPMILLTLLLWGLVVVNYWFSHRFQGIVAVILILASLVPLGIAAYRFMWWRAEEYIVTNLRIIQVEGILSKRSLDSSLGKVNDVQMKQSLLGRWFDYGDIDILTGSQQAVNDLHGINQPFQFKKALIDAKSEFDGISSGRQIRSGYQRQPVARQEPALEPQETEDTARALAALTELRNSGVLSESEYQDKLREVLAG